jgi:hypothetical protein
LRRAAAGAENGSFAGSFSAAREAWILLAMQKVVGSNPISRSLEGLHFAGLFMRAVGWCVFVDG